MTKPVSDSKPVVKCPSCKKNTPNTIKCLNCGYALHSLGWTWRVS
jgi:hypothetical protein